MSSSSSELKQGHLQDQERLEGRLAPRFHPSETLFFSDELTGDITFIRFMNKEVAFLWSKALDSGSTSPAGLASS